MSRFEKATWLVSRGCAMGGAGRHAESIRDFREAIRTYPDNIAAHSGLGIALRDSGRLREALEVLENAPARVSLPLSEKSYSTALDIYPVIATVHMLLGNRKEVVEYARRALDAGHDPVRDELHAFAIQSGVNPPETPGDAATLQLMREMIRDFEGVPPAQASDGYMVALLALIMESSANYIARGIAAQSLAMAQELWETKAVVLSDVETIAECMLALLICVDHLTLTVLGEAGRDQVVDAVRHEFGPAVRQIRFPGDAEEAHRQLEVLQSINEHLSERAAEYSSLTPTPEPDESGQIRGGQTIGVALGRRLAPDSIVLQIRLSLDLWGYFRPIVEEYGLRQLLVHLADLRPATTDP